MIIELCPRCGHPFIEAPGGLRLDPEPCDTGLWLANGSRVTTRDVIHGRPTHAMHMCAPPDIDQLDLFGGAA